MTEPDSALTARVWGPVRGILPLVLWVVLALRCVFSFMQARERVAGPDDESPIRGLAEAVRIVATLAPPVVYAEPEPKYPELFQRLTEMLYPVPVLPYTEAPALLPSAALAVLPVGHEAPGSWRVEYLVVDLAILAPSSSPRDDRKQDGSAGAADVELLQ